MPNLDIWVHVHEFWIIGNPRYGMNRHIMFLEMFELGVCERSMTFL